MKPERKFARSWWLALLGLCFVPCAVPFSCGHNPDSVLARVPIGSKLSELDDHLGKYFDESQIEEWETDGFGKRTETKYGTFFVRDIGGYESWVASKEGRDAFTGELHFYHFCWIIPDDIAPSYVLVLTYIDGVLKEKYYGILPG